MSTDDLGKCSDGGTVPALGECPGRADHHEGVRVLQGVHQDGQEGDARPAPTHRLSRIHGAPSHPNGALGQRREDVGRRERAEAGESAERRFLHAGVRVGQSLSGGGDIALVSGLCDVAPAKVSTPVPTWSRAPAGALIRGRIVGHRTEYVRP